jgi:large subunit ribosomal protein L22
VRLRSETLKQLARDKGLSVEKLAEAVARTGLDASRAASAVKNWLAGRDHPRCKSADIERLAQALGAKPKDIARFTSRVMHHRGSPRKASLLADLIRGRSYEDALNQLAFSPKRAALNIRKALDAAYAEAEQAEADVTALIVAESRVDDGPRIKRFQPKDRGRAHPIIKRLSHITIGLEERV